MMVLPYDDQYVLNHCTKFLARRNTDRRHDFGQYAADDPRARICEAWRFPIIDSAPQADGYAFNRVTFVFHRDSTQTPQELGIVGTFATLYEPIPLTPVRFLGDETAYLAVSIRVPKGQVHRYKFVGAGQAFLDPINPQETIEPNGDHWSRFFTHLCTQPLSFEAWEFALLERLVDHIMPFQTDGAQIFLNNYYNFLDQQDQATQYAFAYRLDQSIGIVNYIDNIVAREESHHLIDYRLCLRIIAAVLRQRAPSIEPQFAAKELFVELYGQMSSGTVPAWDYGAYSNPAYFLQILRRHAYTGAFSHPKYGGNTAALGWQYLADRYKDADGTLFDWRRSVEPPLGVNGDYRG